jgi:hypothetical protein
MTARTIGAFIGSCGRKSPYRSRSAAKQIKRDHARYEPDCLRCKSGRAMDVYKCGSCGLFHVGHPKVRGEHG